MDDARRGAEQLAQARDEVVHARRDTGADVVDAAMPARERRDHGLGDVADVDVVPLVPPVAVERDRLAPLPAADKDRDDAALEIAPLARAVDVREAQRDRRESRRRDDLLGLRLEAAVVRGWTHGPVLVRADRRLAVDRAAR